MPWRRVASRTASRKPGSGSSTRCSGSTITAASSCAWRSIIPVTALVSLNGATSTVSPDCGGHAHRVGLRARIVRRDGRHRAPQPVVVHAVPRAFEFQDLVAAGEGARDAQRVERRFGPRSGVVNDVRAGNRLDQPLGQDDLGLVEKVEGRPLRQLLRDRRRDRRMRVTEERRPRAQVIVEVLAPRDVPDAAAFATRDDEVQFGREDEEPETAAGEEFAGGGEQYGLAFGSVHDDRVLAFGRSDGGVDFVVPAIIVPPIGLE